MTRIPIALAHDYLTQRGGAERVLVALSRAFPQAPIYTTVYEADGTYDALRERRIHTTPLQRIGPMRRNPRLALPLLAPATSRHRIDADVTICQTTGWAHGMPVTGAKVVYAHNTPRWLYQRAEYLANLPRWYAYGLKPLNRPLRQWDKRAAASADIVLAGSGVARERIRSHWGRDAEILYPPPGLSVEGDITPTEGVEPGYLLTVARLLPYKRVDVLIAAVADLPDSRLIIVGDGPDRARLTERARDNVTFIPQVDDAQLRWLYQNAAALVTASKEDFGLTPLEAMGFGTPAVAVAEGGFLETVEHGVSGMLFDAPDADSLRRVLEKLDPADFDRGALADRAAMFSEAAFATRFREIAAALAS